MTEIDEVAGELIEQLHQDGRQIVIVSEYGIGAVNDAVSPNRTLREAGLLQVREELGRELLDPGASKAFAVADHQVAHVYLNDERRLQEISDLLRSVEGIASVLSGAQRAAVGLDHPRSGDLVLLSSEDRWFTWDYWLEAHRAPDFACTVDIHRKPGYDPRELFFAHGWKGSKPRLMLKLMAKKLGLRTLMDAISLDTRQVGGSHGVLGPASNGVLIKKDRGDLPDALSCTDVHDIVLNEILQTWVEN